MKTEALLTEHGIDAELTVKLIQQANAQQLQGSTFQSFPSIDGEQVISTADLSGITISQDEFAAFLSTSLPDFCFEDFSPPAEGETLFIPEPLLERIGILLYPRTAFGILNGGSATSYVDSKKNLAYGQEIFASASPVFDRLSPLCSGKPKGSAPGFLHDDGSPGDSFLYMKVRSLLIESLRYHAVMERYYPEKKHSSFKSIPLFQMTSEFTHVPVLRELEAMKSDASMQDLIEQLGGFPEVFTAVQPLIAACTPQVPGKPLEVFTHAWGKEQTPLALPGGHGQNFLVLSDIYRKLYRQGISYAYLGNIDNVGCTVEPVHLALTAIKQADASFEFSFKTPVDVKGGVLVRNSSGRLDCMDIGVGIDQDTVQEHTEAGNTVLFNCATGLFSLEYLHEHLDRIIESLPLRVSNQDKDAGSYSQIEQITWEVIGIIDRPLILGVHKHQRFLAAKLLIEQILTSLAGKLIDPDTRDIYLQSFLKLHEGLNRLLSSRYGYSRGSDERWHPKKPETVRKEAGSL